MPDLQSMALVEGASFREAASWFFQNSADGFAISRSGRILSANAAWCAITRCSPQDAVGMTALDLMHPEDGEAYARIEAVLATVGTAEFEGRLRACDSEWVWVRMTVRRGPDGYAMMVVHDLTTERNGLEEARKAGEANELLRSAAGVIAWRYHPDGDYYVSDISFTAAGEEDVGPGRHIPAEQVVAIVHPDDRPRFKTLIEASVQTGAPGELTYRRMRGEGVWINLRLSWRGSKRGESGKWELIGIAQDVTELSQARDAALRREAEAKAANEVKSQFIANMSHELRTPLNGVLGALRLLEQEPLSADGDKLRTEGVACGVMLTTLVDHILDLSAIESEEIRLSPEPVDGVVLISGVVEMLRPEAEAKGLQLRLTATALTGPIQVDPGRLRQILFNLIGNASKFTLAGGIEVRAVGRGAGADHRLRIDVIDTGIGVSEAAASKLFHPFQQADGSDTRRFGGSGLGLSISNHLARLMDGRLGFDSVVEQGSTFWLDIAAPLAAEDGAAESAESRTQPGLHALVVDDNATNRLVATRLLEALGVSVETASDGALAVLAARRVAFDLIFMDIHMPVLDGIEAARLIREMPAPTGLIPILAMTANIAPVQLARYRDAGMDGLVPKPLSPTQLLGEITRVIETREAAVGPESQSVAMGDREERPTATLIAG